MKVNDFNVYFYISFRYFFIFIIFCYGLVLFRGVLEENEILVVLKIFVKVFKVMVYFVNYFMNVFSLISLYGIMLNI